LNTTLATVKSGIVLDHWFTVWS